jgi:hypothetical protein
MMLEILLLMIMKGVNKVIIEDIIRVHLPKLKSIISDIRSS